MRLQSLQRGGALLGVVQQLPEAALQVLRPPAKRGSDRLVDPRGDQRENEKDEDQPQRDIQGREVQNPPTPPPAPPLAPSLLPPGPLRTRITTSLSQPRPHGTRFRSPPTLRRPPRRFNLDRRRSPDRHWPRPRFDAISSGCSMLPLPLRTPSANALCRGTI